MATTVGHAEILITPELNNARLRQVEARLDRLARNRTTRINTTLDRVARRLGDAVQNVRLNVSNARAYRTRLQTLTRPVDQRVNIDVGNAGALLQGLRRRVQLLRSAFVALRPIALSFVAVLIGALPIIINLVSSLGQAATVIAAALVPAAIAGGAAFAVLAIGLRGILNASKLLTPEARQLHNAFRRWAQISDQLAISFQKRALPGLIHLVNGAKSQLPIIDTFFRRFGNTVRVVANRLNRFIQSPLFTRQFGTIMGVNATVLRAFGGIGFSVFRILSSVAAAAVFQLQRFAQWLQRGLKRFAEFLEQRERTGQLRKDFENMGDTVAQWGRIFGHVFSAVFNTLRTILPVTKNTTDGLERLVARWDRWTKSARGQNRILIFFRTLQNFPWAAVAKGIGAVALALSAINAARAAFSLVSLFTSLGALGTAALATGVALGVVAIAVVGLLAGFALLYVNVKEFRDIVNNTAIVIKNRVQPILDDLSKWWEESLKPALVEVAKQVFPAVQDGIKQITKAWTDNRAEMRVLLDIISVLIRVFGGSLAISIRAIAGLISAQIAWWGALVRLFRNIPGWIGNVIGWFTRLRQQAFALVGRAIQNTIEWFVRLGTNVRRIVSGLVTATINFFRNLGSRVLQIVSNLVRGVINFFRDVGERARRIWSGFVDTVRRLWNQLWAAARNIWQAFRSFIVGAFQSARQALQNIWNNLRNTVQRIWNQLWARARALWNSFRNFISNQFQAIRARLSAIWNQLRQRVVQLWTLLWARARGLWNSFRDFISNQFNRIRTNLVNIWNNLRNRVINIWNNLWSRVRNIWNSVRGFFTTTIPNAFRNMRDAIGRFWNGIINRIRNPLNKVIALFKGLMNKLKNIPGVGGIFNSAIAAATPIGAAIGGLVSAGGRSAPAQLLAGGGYVRGPGSSTSDSIPAMLSNREFVINAKATNEYGPALLHAINNRKIPTPSYGKMRHYLRGGLVEPLRLAQGGAIDEIIGFARKSGAPVRVTSTYRPGDPGYHGNRRAVDFGGFNQHKLATHFLGVGTKLLELIHKANNNRSYSVKNGKRVGAGFWGASTWNAHANHVHVAANPGFSGGGGQSLLGKLGSLIGGVFGELFSRATGIWDNLKGGFNNLLKPFSDIPFGPAIPAMLKSIPEKMIEAVFGGDDGGSAGLVGGSGTVMEQAYKQAKSMNASRKVLIALFEAGFVESGFRNLNYGDRDSLGFLQQRPSQGWGTRSQILNVAFATRSFVSRAKAIERRNPGISPGSLAQAVQVSAFPGRYSQNFNRAIAALRRVAGSSNFDQGGVLTDIPGINTSGQPEAVLTGRQWGALFSLATKVTDPQPIVLENNLHIDGKEIDTRTDARIKDHDKKLVQVATARRRRR